MRWKFAPKAWLYIYLLHMDPLESSISGWAYLCVHKQPCVVKETVENSVVARVNNKYSDEHLQILFFSNSGICTSSLFSSSAHVS